MPIKETEQIKEAIEENQLIIDGWKRMCKSKRELAALFISWPMGADQPTVYIAEQAIIDKRQLANLLRKVADDLNK